VSIAEGLAEVRARIERAALASGRDPARIRLVAVTKTKAPDAVREAFAAGQRAFGENYAQELAAKAEACADLQGIEWHFIGHLQTNKARVVARHAHCVQTVDSVPLARELGKRAAAARGEEGLPLPVLIEVNVAHEPQKSGAAPSDIEEVMRAVQAEKALSLTGLMTVPPRGNLGVGIGDLGTAKRAFETLVSLRNLHGGPAVLPELSMGMTSDLEVAVACGATIVRVGTAIFGQRTRTTG
jgi:pyridoxal phosphate enzyme (YggS family)